MKDLSQEDNVQVKDRESPHFGRRGWIAAIASSEGRKQYEVFIYRGGARLVVPFRADQLRRLPT
jgi:hypothetical protein